MKILSIWLIASGLIASSLPVTAEAEPPASEAVEQIKPLMRQNLDTLLELQEYAASPERFLDPKNQAEIARRIDRLEGLAHVLPQATGADRPGLSALAAVFSEYLEDLRSGLKSGNPVYLRNRLRTAVGFCFQCHTSSATDRAFIDAERRVEKLKLTPFQKAEFFAATRQFDKALAAYKALMERAPENAARSTELVHAVRNALILAVRVKQDPALAEDLLRRIEKREDLSAYFRGQIKAWKKDVAGWKKEKKPAWTAAAPWLDRARRFSDRAGGLQDYPADHAGDVSYLRAVSFAHEALARNPDALQKARAFFILGDAYAVLEDPLLWNLDDYYFEACIEAAPHTPDARACFDRWLQETTFGYTGSLGTEIPFDVSEKMERLRRMAY